MTENLGQSYESKLPEQQPKKSYFSKGQSALFYILTIIISVLTSIVLTLIVLPFLLQVSPIDLYTGKAFERGNKKTTIIKTTSEQSAITEVAKKLSPSVVNIKVKKISTNFFDQSQQEGEGSGVIFRKDGYILTNNHVVEGASEILVNIGDDTNIKATVVGADAENDVAVVKVGRNNLNAAEFDRSKPEVGQLAVAIGSPLGFEHTVTSGIVSAVNRVFDIPEEDLSQKTFTDLIQTDTAINPGNSGGALANAEGKVIGINTLIASQSGGSEGIGFAIPVDTALNVADQLMKTGKASHPYIGILGHDLTKELAQKNNLPVDEGAVIEEITPESPAAKAKLKSKDIIVQFNGNKVSDMEDLITFVRREKVGNSVTLNYYRGSSKKSAKLKLAEKPSQ